MIKQLNIKQNSFDTFTFNSNAFIPSKKGSLLCESNFYEFLSYLQSIKIQILQKSFLRKFGMSLKPFLTPFIKEGLKSR